MDTSLLLAIKFEVSFECSACKSPITLEMRSGLETVPENNAVLCDDIGSMCMGFTESLPLMLKQLGVKARKTGVYCEDCEVPHEN